MTLSHRSRRHSPSPAERGETLIELMATVVLMGIGIVAIVGALIGVIQTSSLHRRTTRAANETVNVAEYIRSQDYVPCANAATYALPTPPPQYSYSITSVKVLQSATAATPTWITVGSGCSAATDQGAEMITIAVKGTSGPSVVRTLSVIKRQKVCPATGTQGC